MKIRLIAVILLFFSIFYIFPVNIRGELTGIITISTGKASTEFLLHDLTAIVIENTTFIERIDLTLTIPEELSKYRDSFMINIYSTLNNKPDKLLRTYTGSKTISTVIPVSNKMFISIPLTDNPGSDIIPGTVLSSKVEASGFPLLLSVTPVMKGIPSSVLTSVFKLEIIPVLSNKGILNINVSNPSPENSYTIIMDGKEISDKKNIVLLTGIHSIKIESDYFRPFLRSFVIEKGVTTEISLELTPLLPTVIFESPAGTIIYLDGNKLNHLAKEGIQIEPGEHVVRIELNDYSLSKKFTVTSDKNYIISLSLDIIIQDN